MRCLVLTVILLGVILVVAGVIVVRYGFDDLKGL